MNKPNNNRNTNSGNFKTEKINFENTLDGQLLLNSISPYFQKIRKENQYVGETRIMQNLARKQKQSSYSEAFNEEFNPVSKDNDKYGSIEKKLDISIYGVNKKSGYSQGNSPKN